MTSCFGTRKTAHTTKEVEEKSINFQIPTRATTLLVYQSVGCARKLKHNKGNGQVIGERPRRTPNHPKADVLANAPIRLHGEEMLVA